jgi:hypothetical protein
MNPAPERHAPPAGWKPWGPGRLTAPASSAPAAAKLSPQPYYRHSSECFLSTLVAVIGAIASRSG